MQTHDSISQRMTEHLSQASLQELSRSEKDQSPRFKNIEEAAQIDIKMVPQVRDLKPSRRAPETRPPCKVEHNGNFEMFTSKA
jgi:hypothetical protein